jgi:hypothetical protein
MTQAAATADIRVRKFIAESLPATNQCLLSVLQGDDEIPIESQT